MLVPDRTGRKFKLTHYRAAPRRLAAQVSFKRVAGSADLLPKVCGFWAWPLCTTRELRGLVERKAADLGKQVCATLYPRCVGD